MDSKSTKWLLLGGGALAALGWWWASSSSSGSGLSGLLGVGDSSADQADLVARLSADPRIPDQVRRWVPQVVMAASRFSPANLSEETWVRLILADIEQESGGDPLVVGDAGKSFGLMQIHIDYHPDFAALPVAMRFDPQTNIDKGVSLLAGLIDYWTDAFPQDRLLAIRAALAEYNAGRGGVTKAISQGLDVDSFTYLRNYSSSVLRRFRAAGGFGTGS